MGRYIRICDILNSFTSAKRLEQDNIIPFQWIQEQYRIQSLKMLKIENGHDDGPDDGLCKLLQSHDELLLNKKGVNTLIDSHMNLYNNIMRCGRELNESHSFCWRWTGFNYGMDLIMSYKHKKRQISVTRNCKELTAMTSVSMVDQRSIVCKLQVFKL